MINAVEGNGNQISKFKNDNKKHNTFILLIIEKVGSRINKHIIRFSWYYYRDWKRQRKIKWKYTQTCKILFLIYRGLRR